MLLSDLHLLQPIVIDGVVGYINFICEDYVTMIFMDTPLPTSMNSRWVDIKCKVYISAGLNQCTHTSYGERVRHPVLHRTSDPLSNHHRKNNGKYNGQRPVPDRNSRSDPYAYSGQLGKCNNTPHRGIFLCIIEMEKTTRLISRFVFSHPITFDNEEKVS